jgi:5'(3')-deoxyribonucleotidase
MIYCVDIDNTINNLQEAVTNLFNERYGTDYSIDTFDKYDIANVLSVKEANLMQDMYSEKGIYDYVKPIKGSQEALKKLIKNGHQVYLVTDAISSIYDEKVRWVKHFFPFIGDEYIVAMKHKHLFRCDVMIEDNLQNLLAGQHYDRVCINYKWNSDVYDDVYGIYRCSGWDDVMNAVNKLNDKE